MSLTLNQSIRLLVSVGLLLLTACQPKELVPTEFSLLSRVVGAQMADGTLPGKKISPANLEIEGERLRTLFQHPDSRVVFSPVRLGEQPRLLFAVGLEPRAWERGSDGVRFRVLLAGAEENAIYDRLLSRADVTKERPWIHEEVPLEGRLGDEVELILETSSGPAGDRNFDWAHWGDPRVVTNLPRLAGPNLLLISMDTLRADAVGAFGGRGGITPVIDRLAERGTTFQMAHSASAWTRPAHFSMLTGRYPDRRMLRYDATNCPLVPEVETLAEHLSEAGFASAAFTGGAYISAAAHFDQGFSTFESHGRRMGPNLDAIDSWLERYGQQRFFLFLHNFNAHRPYDPPAEELARLLPSVPDACRGITFGDEQSHSLKDACLKGEGGREYLRAIYEAEAAHVDALLGRVLERMRELEVLDSTLVVLTSDHGDELLDHGGLDHIGTLYEELVRVPLVFAGPGVQAGNRVETPVGTIDIVPTVLDLLLGTRPAALEGRRLSGALAGESLPRAPVFMASGFDTELGAFRKHVGPFIAAVVDGRWKLILHETVGEPRLELYDLSADPAERKNLWGADKGPEEELLEKLSSWARALPAEGFCGEAAMPAELREQLEALGYLQ